MERVDLPFFRVDLSPPFLIFTHGLGSSYPKVKSHKNDAWVNVAAEASKLNNNSFLTYTARGHGDSKGWQVTASLNLFQFTWKSLASDMATVADSEGIDKFVAGGSSMGSATALFCAIQHPERVLGNQTVLDYYMVQYILDA